MNRPTATFIAFLALATLSGGIGFRNGQTWLAGGNALNALVFGICAVVFALAMLVLGRIVYLSAQWRVGEERWKCPNVYWLF